MTMTKPSMPFLGLLFLLTLFLVFMVGMTRLGQEEAPGTAPPTAVRIVFFGDSITESGNRPGGYVSLIRETLERDDSDPPVEVIGAGIAGNRVPDLLARLERDVLAQSPTHVVIYIGVNDVWHHEFAGLSGTGPQIYEKGLRKLISQIQTTGAGVSLCTPSVMGENPDGNAPLDQRLQDYSAISRRVAGDEGAHLCDLQAEFRQYLQGHNPDGLKAGILTTDGVHLNDRGNRFVADVLLEHLRPLLR